VQPEMRPYFYPEQHVEDPAHVSDVKRTAERRLGEMFVRIDGLLGEGPYLLGQQYSAADPYLFMLVRWGRRLKAPPRELPNLARHADRMLARPAIRRTLDREGIVAPFI
jgi:glutathione S-transferase